MLLKHSLLYLFARGVPGIINFLAIAVYTRLLPPEEYGQYALVIAWVGFVNAILFQWLRLGLLRFLPGYQENNRATFLGTILVAFLGITVTTAVIGLFALMFWPTTELLELFILGFGLLVLQAWYELNLELLRSKLAPLTYGMVSLVRAVLALMLGWYLAVRGLGAAGLVIGLVGGFLIPGMWAVRRDWQGVSVKGFDRATLKKLLVYGLPLTATFALNFVVSSSDRIMLGWLKGTEAAGLYAVGYDLAQQTLVMLMMVVNLAAYPLAVRSLEQRGIETARLQLQQNCTVLLAIAMPAATGLAILAPSIAHVLLGEAFRETARGIVPIICLGAFVMGLKAYYFDLSFQLGQQTQGQVWVALVSAIINLCLNLWWIPTFGLYGAAYATLFAYVIGLILSIFIGRSIFCLPFPVADAVKLAVATIVMGLALWPVAQYRGVGTLTGQVLLGLMVYTIFLIILDVLNSRSNLLPSVRSYVRKRMNT